MSVENKNEIKCQGNCKVHRGQILRVEVRDISTGKDWGLFHYCESAIEEDRKRGLTVSILDYLGGKPIKE